VLPAARRPAALQALGRLAGLRELHLQPVNARGSSWYTRAFRPAALRHLSALSALTRLTLGVRGALSARAAGSGARAGPSSWQLPTPGELRSWLGQLRHLEYHDATWVLSADWCHGCAMQLHASCTGRRASPGMMLGAELLPLSPC
jgi:hypothetical protein